MKDCRTEVKVEGVQSSIRGEKLLHFLHELDHNDAWTTFLKIVEGKGTNLLIRSFENYPRYRLYILLTVAKWYLIFYGYGKQSKLPGYLSRLIRKNVLMHLCIYFILYIYIYISNYFNDSLKKILNSTRLIKYLNPLQNRISIKY